MKLKLKMEKKMANDWMCQSQKNPINNCIMPQTRDKKDIVLVFQTKHFILTPHQVTHNQRLIYIQ